jgi:ferredoxin
MADRSKRIADNVLGAFYVDRECIDCDLCRETAPENFQRNEDEGYSYVYKQPSTEEEIRLCEEALEGCPVEAIGNDGEDEDGDDPSAKDGEQEAPTSEELGL